MPQTRPNKGVVPVGSDPYALTQDMAAHNDSLNVIIPVADLAERNALTPFAGMTIVRLDRDNFMQQHDGTSWRFIGQPKRYITPATDFANRSGTASRLIATAPVPTKDYAQRVSLFGRLSVYCPTIASGQQVVNVAVSIRQSDVANAQSKSRMSWTAGFSDVTQTANLEVLNELVPAGGQPLTRLWIEVVSGTLSTTVATPFEAFQSLYADVIPEND